MKLKSQLRKEPLVFGGGILALKFLLNLQTCLLSGRSILQRNLWNNCLVQTSIKIVPRGHDMVEVNNLQESFDAAALGNFLLGHTSQDLRINEHIVQTKNKINIIIPFPIQTIFLPRAIPSRNKNLTEWKWSNIHKNNKIKITPHLTSYLQGINEFVNECLNRENIDQCVDSDEDVNSRHW